MDTIEVPLLQIRNTDRQLHSTMADSISELAKLKTYVHDPDPALSTKIVQKITICILAFSRYLQCRITSSWKVATQSTITAKRLWLTGYATSPHAKMPPHSRSRSDFYSDNSEDSPSNLTCKSSSNAFTGSLKCETTFPTKKPLLLRNFTTLSLPGPLRIQLGNLHLQDSFAIFRVVTSSRRHFLVIRGRSQTYPSCITLDVFSLSLSLSLSHR